MTHPTVTIHHRTTYRFDHPVRLGPHQIRLHPAPTVRARLLSYALTIQPEPGTLHWNYDPLANRIARASFAAETDTLEIDVTAALELTAYNPFDFVMDAEAAMWPFQYQAAITRELAPYSQPPPTVPWLVTTFAGLDLAPQSAIGLLVALNQRVHGLIRYVTRLEPGVQDPAVTIGTSSGSCRDVAWLMVQAARVLGFAARFVSGYLVQLVDPAAPVPGLAEDTADLHAWVEVYLPGAGWIGFDATSGLINGPGHIALAAAAHPESAAPVDGTTSAAVAHLDTEMTVTRR
jgi:transglutaminase-like putative cysteine protease